MDKKFAWKTHHVELAVEALRDRPHGKTALRGTNLQDADLRGADLQGVDLQGVNLQEANLTGANLQDADLRGANLLSSCLYGANLRGTWLRGADLRYSRLKHTNLQGAFLYDADLRGAFLYGANLQGARLTGANLQGAHGIAFLYAPGLYKDNALYVVSHPDRVKMVLVGEWWGTLEEYISHIQETRRRPTREYKIAAAKLLADMLREYAPLGG